MVVLCQLRVFSQMILNSCLFDHSWIYSCPSWRITLLLITWSSSLTWKDTKDAKPLYDVSFSFSPHASKYERKIIQWARAFFFGTSFANFTSKRNRIDMDANRLPWASKTSRPSCSRFPTYSSLIGCNEVIIWRVTWETSLGSHDVTKLPVWVALIK